MDQKECIIALVGYKYEKQELLRYSENYLFD
jgi:hypothetical protein